MTDKTTLKLTTKQKGNPNPKTDHLKPWQFKKGQIGNPKGRPKGKTLKEYCRDFLAKQTPAERADFLEGLSKETIWKMSEGNPQTDVTSGGKPIVPGAKDKEKSNSALNEFLDENSGDIKERQPKE